MEKTTNEQFWAARVDEERESKERAIERITDLEHCLTHLLKEAKHMRGTIWEGALHPQREKIDPLIKLAEQLLNRQGDGG